MPKPDFDQFEPRDIIWLEDAIDHYLRELEKPKYKTQVMFNGIKRLREIRKLLEDCTEYEYNNNRWSDIPGEPARKPTL